MPDRNEAVSYACAALATKGDMIIENASAGGLTAFLKKVKRQAGGLKLIILASVFGTTNPSRATDLTTQPHPGFMTDWQPLWTLLMTQAKGKSEVLKRFTIFVFNTPRI